MKTTKHMTIRQKLNTEKAAGIVCTMPLVAGGNFQICHHFGSVTTDLRIDRCTAFI